MKKLLLLLSITLFIFTGTKAQLSAGDIAFIGFQFDTPDGFTFITLTNMSAGEQIYFTDHSWDNGQNTWHNNTADAHYLWTVPPGGLPIGTIVDVSETSTANILSVSTGTISKETAGDFSLIQSGDVLIAYQSTSGAKPLASAATFLAAIYTDDNYAHNTNCDGSQGWYNGYTCASEFSSGPVSNGANASGIPPGLTNSLNAMHLYPSPILESSSENDNGRYTGTLTGDAATIMAAINDRTNWEMEDNLSTPFVTTSVYFNSNTTVNITPTSTCNNPTIPTLTYSPTTVCSGNSTTLSISGTLNDATEWYIYTGSCGGTLVGGTTTSTFAVTPTSASTTYYVRGEGGCVTPGSCASITVTQNPSDDPSFGYATSTFCQAGTDPTPTITGLAGGNFSAESGLSINTTSGVIDLSTSTTGIYNVKYVANGTCPDSSTTNITIGGVTYGYDVIAVCDTYTWIDGNTYTTSNNTATHTLTNSLGCDSIATLNLTINNVTLTTNTNNVTCNAGNDGDVIVNTTTGSAPFVYNWFDNSGTNINPTLAFQSFESSGQDNWNYTADPIPYATETDSVISGSDDIWSVIRAFTGNIDTASNGVNFWGTQDLTNNNGGRNSFHTLTFDPIDISTQGELKLEFDYYSKGFESVDLLEYEILFDNGTTWSANGTSLSKNNLMWETVSTVVPASANYVRLRIQVKQDGSADFSGWDNIKLFSTSSAINNLTANNYSVSVTDNNGCIGSSNFTITEPVALSSTDVISACNSYTWIDGNTYTADNSSATHTLTNVAGCDSVVTLNLTILTTLTSTDTQIACDSYTWIDGNTYTTSNNSATHTLTSSQGCDSIVTLNLTINNANTGTDTQIACDSYTWIDGNVYTADNSTAMHTLTNVAGCDSVVTLNLTINSSSTGTDTQVSCDSYTWIDGNTYTTSNNTATHTLTNMTGCDSIVTLNLTINNSNTGIDMQTACKSYTWIDGNTYTADNNTATHTLTNVAGCDSVITLNLTILTTLTSTDTQIACDSYTWIDGNTYTTSNNSATHTLTSSQGCDSIVTLNLTINNANTGIDTQTACDSYTWIDGNVYTSNNSIATHTLINVAGCDSVVTLNLTLNNSSTSTDTQVACDSYTWIDGNTYTTSNNSATHTLTNATGCDSIVTLNLTINNSNTGIDMQTACNSYTWIDGNTYTADNNTATYTLTNAKGCDSLVTLNLIINSAVSSSQTVTICGGESLTVGTTNYTTSGNYTTTLVAANGCDSIVTTNLTVETEINTYVERLNAVFKVTSISGATYQWIDCENGNTPIAGETSSTYTATTPGFYAVVVTSGSCTKTSICNELPYIVGMEQNQESKISVYPNPTQDIATIELNNKYSNATLMIVDITGKVIHKQLVKNQLNVTIATHNFEKGVYFINVQAQNQSETIQLIKQ